MLFCTRGPHSTVSSNVRPLATSRRVHGFSETFVQKPLFTDPCGLPQLWNGSQLGEHQPQAAQHCRLPGWRQVCGAYGQLQWGLRESRGEPRCSSHLAAQGLCRGWGVGTLAARAPRAHKQATVMGGNSGISEHTSNTEHP